MGFRKTFNEFEPATRCTLIASCVVGLLLLVGLSLTDAGFDLRLWGWDPKPGWLKQFNAEWLHGHPYILNIYSAITGFLFGAPIAAVVLATFEIQRQEKADIKKANRASLKAWRQLKKAVDELCNDQRLEGLIHDAIAGNNPDSVLAIHGRIVDKLDRYLDGSGLLNKSEQDYEAVAEFFNSEAPAFESAFKQVNNKVGVGHSKEGQRAWAKAVSSWRYMDSTLRTERYGLNLAWFDEDLNSDLVNMISNHPDPFVKFSLLHGGTNPFDQSPSLATAVSAANALAVQKSKDSFESMFAIQRSRIGYGPKSAYIDEALHLHTYLTDLAAVIANIEHQNWPGCAVTPVDDANDEEK